MCFNSNIASSFTSKNVMLARKSILTSEITETMKVLENVFQIQLKDISVGQCFVLILRAEQGK